MNFRKTMDKIWSSKIEHYLYLFLLVTLCIGHFILPLSREVILIGIGTITLGLFAFRIYFSKTIDAEVKVLKKVLQQ